MTPIAVPFTRNPVLFHKHITPTMHLPFHSLNNINSLYIHLYKKSNKRYSHLLPFVTTLGHNHKKYRHSQNNEPFLKYFFSLIPEAS